MKKPRRKAMRRQVRARNSREKMIENKEWLELGEVSKVIEVVQKKADALMAPYASAAAGAGAGGGPSVEDAVLFRMCTIGLMFLLGKSCRKMIYVALTVSEWHKLPRDRDAGPAFTKFATTLNARAKSECLSFGVCCSCWRPSTSRNTVCCDRGLLVILDRRSNTSPGVQLSPRVNRVKSVWECFANCHIIRLPINTLGSVVAVFSTSVVPFSNETLNTNASCNLAVSSAARSTSSLVSATSFRGSAAATAAAAPAKADERAEEEEADEEDKEEVAVAADSDAFRTIASIASRASDGSSCSRRDLPVPGLEHTKNRGCDCLSFFPSFQF